VSRYLFTPTELLHFTDIHQMARPYVAGHVRWFLSDFGATYFCTTVYIAVDGRRYSANWLHV